MNKAIKEVCKAHNKAFKEFEQYVMDWGRSTKSLQKNIQEILALNNNPEYPKGYGGMSTGNYLLSLILTDPKAIKKLYAKHEAALSAATKQIVLFWKENPAFWCFFTIKEILGDDFLTIEDLLRGEEHLLYSPGVCGMQKSGESRGKHYLVLMLPNGECLQTAGIIRFFSLSKSDLNLYCDLFDPDEDLEPIINKHYSKFFMLDTISTLPQIGHRGYPVQYVWQEFTLKDFAVGRLSGKWVTKELGNLSQYAFDAPDESMRSLPNGELLFPEDPMMGATLYRNNDTGVMGLTTNTKASYTIFQALFNQVYPELDIPEEPAIAISMSLLTLVDRMGFALPWMQFKEIRGFDIKSVEEAEEDQYKTNILLREYMLAKNAGKVFDPKAFSKESGMDLEDVEGILESLELHSKRTMPSYETEAEDKQYELTGWPVPPPAMRFPFNNGLKESGLFLLDEGPMTLQKFEALTGGTYKEDIFDIGLLEFVEEMFIEHFGYELSFVLMNTFFWILFHKGKDWLLVRSYAIEILKLFPYILDNEYSTGEEFIEDFSQFTRKILCTHGICSIKARPKATEVPTGMYAIKGSDAFYSLIEGMNV